MKKKIEIVGWKVASKIVRELLLRKQKNKCFYCGVDLVRYYSGAKNDFNTDHLTPITRGGDNSLENLVACCRACNQRKRSKTLKEYINYLKEKKISFPKNLSQKMGGKETFSKKGSEHMAKIARKRWREHRRNLKNNQ